MKRRLCTGLIQKHKLTDYLNLWKITILIQISIFKFKRRKKPKFSTTLCHKRFTPVWTGRFKIKLAYSCAYTVDMNNSFILNETSCWGNRTVKLNWIKGRSIALNSCRAKQEDANGVVFFCVGLTVFWFRKLKDEWAKVKYNVKSRSYEAPLGGLKARLVRTGWRLSI